MLCWHLITQYSPPLFELTEHTSRKRYGAATILWTSFQTEHFTKHLTSLQQLFNKHERPSCRPPLRLGDVPKR
jgi:hypothetical protein